MQSKREQEGILEPILERTLSLNLDFSDEDIALMAHLWNNTGSNYEGVINFLNEDKKIRDRDTNELVQIDQSKKLAMLDFLTVCQQLEAVCAGDVFPIILKNIVIKNFQQQTKKIPIDVLAGNEFPVILDWTLAIFLSVNLLTCVLSWNN